MPGSSGMTCLGIRWMMPATCPSGVRHARGGWRMIPASVGWMTVAADGLDSERRNVDFIFLGVVREGPDHRGRGVHGGCARGAAREAR